MPKDYVVPNVNEDLQGRLQNITQQMLSQTRLLQISGGVNLYPKNRGQLSPDEIVEKMRKDVEIELVQDSRKQVSGFRISYSAPDPIIAQRVTSELANLFIDENLQVRQAQSEGTTKFLKDRMVTAQRDLEAQEERIREFKGQHVAELPTQLGTNLQVLSGLQSQLQTENIALNTAKQKQAYLETLVHEYRSLRGASQSPEDSETIDQDLDRLKKRLADLSSRYTDEHPEVRALKGQIAAREKLRDQSLADLKATGSSSQSNVSPAKPAEDSADVKTQPQLFQLQSQLHANQVEISNHEKMIADLKVTINEYQARLNQEPVREQQLADLTRGYAQAKETYDDLQKKENQSAMATHMEMQQQGEHFRMIDPPSLPVKPSFPDHVKFNVVGLFVGLVLGVGVAGSFEKMDDRVYNEQELKDLLPVAVISELPVITTPVDERAEQKKVWLGWATTAMIFAAILAGSTVSYLAG